MKVKGNRNARATVVEELYSFEDFVLVDDLRNNGGFIRKGEAKDVPVYRLNRTGTRVRRIDSKSNRYRPVSRVVNGRPVVRVVNDGDGVVKAVRSR